MESAPAGALTFFLLSWEAGISFYPRTVKRVAHPNSGKAREVAICSPQFADSVFSNECRDMRVMGKIAGGLTRPEKPLHERGMPRPFPKQR